MRHVRTSTWVLTAVFLAALITWLLVKPSSGSTIHHAPAPRQHATTRAPAPGVPGIVPTPSRTPSLHATPSGSPSTAGASPSASAPTS